MVTKFYKMRKPRSKSDIARHGLVKLLVSIEYPDLTEKEDAQVDDAIWKFMCGYMPETNLKSIISMSLDYTRIFVLQPNLVEDLLLTMDNNDFFDEIIAQIEN